MAAEMKTRTDRQSTIAFTLPISCQICLGKVKQPVLCPNNHAFCSPCMDVWLEKNSQCPACRVPISGTNPVRQILGGLNHVEDDKDKMTNPELRKARFDLLYKEYEREFDKLLSDAKALRTENEIMSLQLDRQNRSGNVKSDMSHARDSDPNGLLALTKKLQDAQKLYEKLKDDMGKIKQENAQMKDENVTLTRENERLRGEITSRSPHRYGRYTVATLEAKIEGFEKEIKQLNKALEKSDRYVEELQKELESYRRSGGNNRLQERTRHDTDKYQPSARIETDEPYRRKLFDDVSSKSHSKDNSAPASPHSKGRAAPQSPSLKRPGSSFGKEKANKRVHFNLAKNDSTSFDLEAPSSLTLSSAGTSPSKDSKYQSNQYSSQDDSILLRGGQYQPRGMDYKRQIKEKFSLDDSEDSLLNGKVIYSAGGKRYTATLDDSFTSDLYGKNLAGNRNDHMDVAPSDAYSKDYKYTNRYNIDESMLTDSLSSDLPKSYKDYISKDKLSKPAASTDLNFDDSSDLNLSYPRDTKHLAYLDSNFDDTNIIRKELDDLNISITPDFTDCMKILNRAEQKVHTRTSSDGESVNGLGGLPEDLKSSGMYQSLPPRHPSRPSHTTVNSDSSSLIPDQYDVSSRSTLSHLGGKDHKLPPSRMSYPLPSDKSRDKSSGRSRSSHTGHHSGSSQRHLLGSLRPSSSLQSLNEPSVYESRKSLDFEGGGRMTRSLSLDTLPLESNLKNFHSSQNERSNPSANNVRSGHHHAPSSDILYGSLRPSDYSKSHSSSDRLFSSLPLPSNKTNSNFGVSSTGSRAPSSSSTSNTDHSVYPSSSNTASSSHQNHASMSGFSSNIPSSSGYSSTYSSSNSSSSKYPATNGNDFGSHLSVISERSESKANNHYSYLSNTTNDFSSRQSDLFLPEPKKRLFDTDEDISLSAISPIKSTRVV